MGEDPKFNNTILTNIGHQMLTSITSGNRKITYTKAEAYTQDVSSITNEVLQGLTSLQGKELSTNLLVSNDNGNIVTITANFENKGLTNNVVFNSIGWFAKLDTDDAKRGITANQEYLVGITPANGAQTLVAPPADQSASQAISLNLNMTLSDATNVNMTVSDAGAVHFNQLYDQLAEYTTTSDLTKLLAGKADLGLSYTKAELDAKLLNLTTDTNGKVSANQVQALISDKANISDVYTKSQIDSDLSTRDVQINAKANTSDVYTKTQIDSDLSARDTQITNATSLANKAQATANTKANASDVTEISGRLGKLEGTQTLDSPDFNSITASGVYYITNNNVTNIKNNPVGTWGVLVVSNGDGHRASQVYYPDDGNSPWCRSLNESNWLPWYQLSTKKDVSNATDLANQAQTTADTKADASNVYTKQQTDGKLGQKITFVKCDSPQVAADASSKPADDGSIVIGIYDMNDEPNQAVVGDQKINIEWLYNHLSGLQSQVSGLSNLQLLINGKADSATVYTKTQVDQMIASAGKVKTVNGVQPDNGGNISIAIPDISGKANSTDVASLQNQINSKVNVTGTLYRIIQNSNTWNDIFGVDNPNNVLTSLRINQGGSGSLLNEWAAGIGFGGTDTKGVLSVDCSSHQARITGGNGTAPTWSEDIAWKSDITSLQNTINQQNQTIQSLITRLTNAENKISYIKANYIEGKQFPASQEAQATAWENLNPLGVAFITDK
ncbi:pyocin knob domain-containing protein [Lactobacillus helveticus]|uniref:pyocin knob domain-containing protein n=1 Tax=Lactobacillus helveticus TaxID=1587 RepID=UPI001564CF22|nr:pyocin knob domain-containing protein [Lactobacillus helveticus]NRO92496.1 hypothetical protein [Lactobacillus helveticus]